MEDLRMPDINTVLIAGNLTRDPVFRKTTNGTPVTNFWIACNRKFKDNNGLWRESVCYVGVVAWYKLAENCAENLAKGSAVVVEGELQSRSFRSDDGRNRNIVEIKARRVQFLNKKSEALGEEDTGEEHTKDRPIAPAEIEHPVAHEEHLGDEIHEHEHEHEIEQPNPDRGKFDYGFQSLQI
jgi:single-strand DNA-binding protein